VSEVRHIGSVHQVGYIGSCCPSHVHLATPMLSLCIAQNCALPGRHACTDRS
jgi:hypothetical protein